ncbi:MAG TPA: hypothetical protein VH596_13550 [Terriglobales bacterium]|jgi:hypothetical protein
MIQSNRPSTGFSFVDWQFRDPLITKHDKQNPDRPHHSFDNPAARISDILIRFISTLKMGLSKVSGPVPTHFGIT